MADQLTKIANNENGTWVFNFTFDDGNGMTTCTAITVPASITDINEARTAAIARASELKADWIAAMQANNLIGSVDL